MMHLGLSVYQQHFIVFYQQYAPIYPRFRFSPWVLEMIESPYSRNTESFNDLIHGNGHDSYSMNSIAV